MTMSLRELVNQGYVAPGRDIRRVVPESLFAKVAEVILCHPINAVDFNVGYGGEYNPIHIHSMQTETQQMTVSVYLIDEVTPCWCIERQVDRYRGVVGHGSDPIGAYRDYLNQLEDVISNDINVVLEEFYGDES